MSCYDSPLLQLVLFVKGLGYQFLLISFSGFTVNEEGRQQEGYKHQEQRTPYYYIVFQVMVDHPEDEAYHQAQYSSYESEHIQTIQDDLTSSQRIVILSNSLKLGFVGSKSTTVAVLDNLLVGELIIFHLILNYLNNIRKLFTKYYTIYANEDSQNRQIRMIGQIYNFDSTIDNNLVNSVMIERDISYERTLKTFKIKANIKSHVLTLRVRLDSSNDVLFLRQLTIQTLPQSWKPFFSSVDQIYDQFKIVQEDLVDFNEKQEFVYVVPLGSKKIYLLLPMSKEAIDKLEEANQQLIKNKQYTDQLLTIIEIKDSQIKKLTNELNQLRKTLSFITSGSKSGVQRQSNEVLNQFVQKSRILQKELPSHLNLPDISDAVHNEQIKLEDCRPQFSQIIVSQKMAEQTQHSIIHGSSLWEQDKNKSKRSKSNVDLNKSTSTFKSQTSFNFFINSKCQQRKYFNFDENVLSLKSTTFVSSDKSRYYTALSQDYIRPGTVVIGLKLLKNSPNSAIIFGLKAMKNSYDRVTSEAYELFSSSYNFKTGAIVTRLQGNDLINENLFTEIKTDDILHVNINIQKKSIKFYCNRLFIGAISLNHSLTKVSLYPFIKISSHSDMILFL